MSDSVERFPPLVRERHHLKVTKRGANNIVPKEWECRGCGERFETKNSGSCEEPTAWVQLGCPGDGLGHCRDCDSLFVFEYESPFYEHECPKCGSGDWYRTDETEANLAEVVGLSSTDTDQPGGT